MKKATFTVLCLEGSVLSFNLAATAALIPSIASEFGIGQFIAGRAVWFYMLPYGAAALLYGPLIRFFDAKRVEITAFSLFCLANLLCALSQDVNMLFSGRFLMGAFGASVTPLVLITIGHSVKPENRGKKVGIFFSATFISSLLGLFLSGFLHWRLIYLLPALIGFILLIFMFAHLPSFKTETQGSKVNYLNAFKDKGILRIFTYIFLISVLYHGIQQWLSVYFSEVFLLGQFAISMLITLTSLSGVFGEAIGGIFADRIGRRKTIDIGIVLMIISVFLLIVKAPAWIIAVLMICWGFGWAFNHVGLSTILTHLPKEFLNEAASLNSSVRFIAGGLGVVAAGFVMKQSFVWGFCVFGVLLLALLFLSKKLIKEG